LKTQRGQILSPLLIGSAVALHCGKDHLQSQWERAKFDLPMTSKSLKFFRSELDVHDYLPEVYIIANFHFTPFSEGFYPDRLNITVLRLFS